MKTRFVVILWATLFLLAGHPATVGFADDADGVISEESEPLDPETAPVELNDTQMAKAQRLSEASGVSQEEIVNMRLGIQPTVPEDPDALEPGTVPEGETAEDLPQGRGWGVIARWLGIHPSNLGNANGRVSDTDGEADGAEEPALLAARGRVRNRRLFGSHSSASNEETTRPQRGRQMSQQNQERRAERAPARAVARARERSNNRGGNGNGSGGNNGGGNGNGRGNSNRGGNGRGRNS